MGAELVIAVDLNHDIVEKRNIIYSESHAAALTGRSRFAAQNTLVRNIIDTLNKRTGAPSALGSGDSHLEYAIVLS